MPTQFVVAGPKRSGNSTLTRNCGFDGFKKIDPGATSADMLIASPAQADRIALRRRQAAVSVGRAHLVETTLSGVSSLRLMAAARKTGLRIILLFVSVGSPGQTLGRIRNRTALCGNNVPKSEVLRRYSCQKPLENIKTSWIYLGVNIEVAASSATDITETWTIQNARNSLL